MMIQIGFKRLRKDAVLPVKAHDSDSGFDLCAMEDVVIEPGETVVIPTGIAVQLPKGYEAQVRPRSGITSDTKLRVQLGTIDQGYTGGIGVIIDNVYVNDTYSNGYKKIRDMYHTICGKEIKTPYKGKYYNTLFNCTVDKYELVEKGTYKIFKGDRIAQLIIQKLPQVEAVEVFDDLKDSERGNKGYGSSGTKALYVSQLSSEEQEEIEKLLKIKISSLGLYSEQEIVEQVEQGMNSKIADLEELIDVSKYMNTDK